MSPRVAAILKCHCFCFGNTRFLGFPFIIFPQSVQGIEIHCLANWCISLFFFFFKETWTVKVEFSCRMHVQPSRVQTCACEKGIGLPASKQLLLWCAGEDTSFPDLLRANELSLTSRPHLYLLLDSSEICHYSWICSESLTKYCRIYTALIFTY